MRGSTLPFWCPSLAEPAGISAIRPELRLAAFARLWARKECYLKGLGPGLGRPLDGDALSGRGDVGDGHWQIAELSAPAGYAAACAVAPRRGS